MIFFLSVIKIVAKKASRKIPESLQTVDKVLRETKVSRGLFLSVYKFCAEKRKFPLGLCLILTY